MSIFNQMAAEFSAPNKSVDDILVGDNSQYLGEGEHEVTIKAVDSSKVDTKQYVLLVLEDAAGKSMKDYVFLMNKEKNGYSYHFRKLLSSLFTTEVIEKTREALQKFIAASKDNNEVCNIFTGMQLKIKVGREKRGYLVKSTGDDKYVTEDAETGKTLLGPFDSYKEAREYMKAETSLFPAKIIVVSRSATHGESNIKILDTAISPKSGAKAAGGNSGMPKFS